MLRILLVHLNCCSACNPEYLTTYTHFCHHDSLKLPHIQVHSALFSITKSTLSLINLDKHCKYWSFEGSIFRLGLNKWRSFHMSTYFFMWWNEVTWEWCAKNLNKIWSIPHRFTGNISKPFRAIHKLTEGSTRMQWALWEGRIVEHAKSLLSTSISNRTPAKLAGKQTCLALIREIITSLENDRNKQR